jgi:hypothetical protein
MNTSCKFTFAHPATLGIFSTQIVDSPGFSLYLFDGSRIDQSKRYTTTLSDRATASENTDESICDANMPSVAGCAGISHSKIPRHQSRSRPRDNTKVFSPDTEAQNMDPAALALAQLSNLKINENNPASCEICIICPKIITTSHSNQSQAINRL